MRVPIPMVNRGQLGCQAGSDLQLQLRCTCFVKGLPRILLGDFRGRSLILQRHGIAEELAGGVELPSLVRYNLHLAQNVASTQRCCRCFQICFRQLWSTGSQQHQALSVVQDARLAMLHRSKLRNRLLQGFQLDADASHLHLPVHSAMVVDAAIRGARGQVASVVHPADAWQLDELRLRLLFLLQVATRKADAPNKQDSALAFFLCGHVFGIQDMTLVGRKLLANRDDVARLHVATSANH
mmetsp:Transcript_22973/g.40552  ORF Transcript_22973/g.40552 Transcript_22973/m.40552 type:complete len:240 (-) Transcript_22973:1148-1867(-)